MNGAQTDRRWCREQHAATGSRRRIPLCSCTAACACTQSVLAQPPLRLPVHTNWPVLVTFRACLQIPVVTLMLSNMPLPDIFPGPCPKCSCTRCIPKPCANVCCSQSRSRSRSLHMTTQQRTRSHASAAEATASSEAARLCSSCSRSGGLGCTAAAAAAPAWPAAAPPAAAPEVLTLSELLLLLLAGVLVLSSAAAAAAGDGLLLLAIGLGLRASADPLARWPSCCCAPVAMPRRCRAATLHAAAGKRPTKHAPRKARTAVPRRALGRMCCSWTDRLHGKPQGAVQAQWAILLMFGRLPAGAKNNRRGSVRVADTSTAQSCREPPPTLAF